MLMLQYLIIPYQLESIKDWLQKKLDLNDKNIKSDNFEDIEKK